MAPAHPMVELWRGGRLESSHDGHAVICDASGTIVEAWGDPSAVIFPRSSCKMLQALPLVESGAADAAGLTEAHLALACASHQGAHLHTDMVTRWLADLGLAEADLRCGGWTITGHHHQPGDPAGPKAPDGARRIGPQWVDQPDGAGQFTVDADPGDHRPVEDGPRRRRGRPRGSVVGHPAIAHGDDVPFDGGRHPLPRALDEVGRRAQR